MLRPHERLVWTHYAFHVNNTKQCSLQPSDDGHEPHVGGQGHFPQRQLRRKRPPNAVNGGALLPVLVVRIPTSANMLNTCTALSKHVGLRSTTSSQPMVYAPMHALFALSLTIISLTRPRVNQACALRVESELRVCLHGLGCWARARALARTFSSTSSSTTFDEAKGGGHRVGRSPPHARNTHTPTPACTVYPHARACLNHPPRRCTPFLPAHAPNPIPHLHSPKP